MTQKRINETLPDRSAVKGHPVDIDLLADRGKECCIFNHKLIRPFKISSIIARKKKQEFLGALHQFTRIACLEC